MQKESLNALNMATQDTDRKHDEVDGEEDHVQSGGRKTGEATNSLTGYQETGDIFDEAGVGGVRALRESGVRDVKWVWAFGLDKVWEPWPAHRGETETRGLKDGPEIPTEEQKNDRDYGRDSAGRVERTVAEKKSDIGRCAIHCGS